MANVDDALAVGNTIDINVHRYIYCIYRHVSRYKFRYTDT